MNTGHSRAVILVIAVFAVALLPAAAPGQSSDWTAPRTAAGHPDLQGMWSNNAITPLERPESLAERATLTEEELSRVQTTAEELFALDAGDAAFGDQFFNTALTAPETFTSSDGGTGNYNQFWMVERDFDDRTSLIVDPPNGRLPELTPEAEQAAETARAGRGQPAAWTDDRGLSERCITFGLPNLLAGYNSYYQILQTADHVVIEQELIHTTRIIPLDGRPHIDGDIDQWHGNSVGRWDGDTLVVETKNLSPKQQLPRVERQPAPRRALHPGRPGRNALRVHRQRPHGLECALDRRAGVEAHRGRDLRVRLPRGQHRHGGHPLRRARRRGESSRGSEQIAAFMCRNRRTACGDYAL